MTLRSTTLKAALAAAVIAVGAAKAEAETIVVNVYSDGYLPNIAYLGDADEITFVNKSGGWVFLDYTSNTTLVPWFSAGSTQTISASLMNSRKLRSPYIWYNQYNRGYSNSSATFETRAGNPPLQ